MHVDWGVDPVGDGLDKQVGGGQGLFGRHLEHISSANIGRCKAKKVQGKRFHESKFGAWRLEREGSPLAGIIN
jgi:hypothetical protein